MEAIHRDPALRWRVEELGEEAGLSRAAFSRRFTALVGRPPLAYLTWWRLTTAARLLRASDVPLSAVAARVGYGSEFAFANVFKREYGTPARSIPAASVGGTWVLESWNESFRSAILERKGPFQLWRLR